MKPHLILGLWLLLNVHCPAAIVYPQCPAGGKAAAAKYLNLDAGKLQALRITNVEPLTVGDPLRWYPSGDLTAGHLLVPGPPWGWDYPLMAGTNAVVYVELDATNRFSSLGKSAFANEALTALRLAADWPQVKAQDYEPRLLNDHLVSLVALWLHGASNDIIIPLPPTYNRMTAYQAYSETEIVKLLEPEAKRDRIMWAKLDAQEKHDQDAYAKAMTDYEKSQGTPCGAISYYGLCAPIQKVSPHVQRFTLWGNSTVCGHLAYKVRVTYEREFDGVKQVEILGKTEFKDP